MHFAGSDRSVPQLTKTYARAQVVVLVALFDDDVKSHSLCLLLLSICLSVNKFAAGLNLAVRYCFVSFLQI